MAHGFKTSCARKTLKSTNRIKHHKLAGCNSVFEFSNMLKCHSARFPIYLTFEALYANKISKLGSGIKHDVFNDAAPLNVPKIVLLDHSL